VAQTWLEVQRDVLSVGPPGSGPQSSLAVEPLVQVLADGLPADLDEGPALQPRQRVVERFPCLTLGAEATLQGCR